MRVYKKQYNFGNDFCPLWQAQTTNFKVLYFLKNLCTLLSTCLPSIIWTQSTQDVTHTLVQFGTEILFLDPTPMHNLFPPMGKKPINLTFFFVNIQVTFHQFCDALSSFANQMKWALLKRNEPHFFFLQTIQNNIS